MSQLLMGRLPAQPELVKMEFKDYASTQLLPDPPQDFGHEKLIPNWGMLGNDQAGCCYVSAAMHNIMLWNAEAGNTIAFSPNTALKYYSELTAAQNNGVGYDPLQTDPVTGDNPTDTGIVVAEALPLLRNIGIPDDTGTRHKIGAYVKLDPGNVEQLWYATYYFDGVILGVKMAQQWMTLFQDGQKVWPALPNPKWIGGHCITSVAWRQGCPRIVSWGDGVEFTQSGYEESGEEVYAVLSLEKLKNGIDLEGLNVAKMQADINDLESV